MRSKKKKCTKPLLVFGIATLVAAVGAVGVYAATTRNRIKMEETVNVDKIYDGISIEQVDVSGKTKVEALMELRQQLSEKTAQEKAIISYQGQKWEIPFSAFGTKYDYENAVNIAWETGRSGELKERYKTIMDLQEHQLNISMDLSYDKEKVTEELQKVAEELNQAAQNSTLTREGGQFVITDEKSGYEMDIAATAEKTEKVIANKKTEEIEPVITETKANITRADNEQVTDLIGSFSTSYSSGAAGRNENLRVGCNNINGTLIAPGEIYSMNVELGPQTYENGYKDAGVYVNGKVEQGVGGGVCQVTTTLYNAAIRAELEIVERYPHSLTVGYVPLGMDSAVAGDYKDLKFKNSTSTPIYIEAYAEGGKLVCNIYGKEEHEAGRSVEFETVREGTVEKPAEKIIQDPTLPKGERRVISRGKTGIRVSVYKKVFQDGNLVSRELFSKSTYQATADEIAVGTKVIQPKPQVVEAPQETATETSTDDTQTDSSAQTQEEAPIGAQ